MSTRVAILGAGLCGNLTAIVLARHGLDVTVYDRGKPPGAPGAAAGRSINLALAARGISALKQADVFAEIEPLLLPMQGRVVHDLSGENRLLPYGQHSDERIWSVSRQELNRELYQVASERWRVTYRFEHACTAFDVANCSATVRSPSTEEELRPDLLLAADGAGSVVRRSLAEAGLSETEEQMLDHGYKELRIPPTQADEFALRPDGLHIWPRGGFMLIALPNRDQSFTATLFLPHRGQPGFDTLAVDRVRDFFAEQFGDALPLMPELEHDFGTNPVGELGTVYCQPWHHSASGRHVLLIGDAAHAIVPFHGQGMNAAFEDCSALADLLAELDSDWSKVLPAFEAARRNNTTAIAEMALENYREMRDTVRDPQFERRTALAFALEQRLEGNFIPRYSMVMFHPEISYAEAQRRGRIQAEILDAAIQQSDDQTALELATRLARERL